MTLVVSDTRDCGWRSHRPPHLFVVLSRYTAPSLLSSFAELTFEFLCTTFSLMNPPGGPGSESVESNTWQTSIPVHWVVSTTAEAHYCNDAALFDTFTPCSNGERVQGADGGYLAISGKGSIRLSILVPNVGLVRHTLPAQCVPGLVTNLLSVAALHGSLQFGRECTLRDEEGRVWGMAHTRSGLYVLDTWPRRATPGATERSALQEGVAYVLSVRQA